MMKTAFGIADRRFVGRRGPASRARVGVFLHRRSIGQRVGVYVVVIRLGDRGGAPGSATASRRRRSAAAVGFAEDVFGMWFSEAVERPQLEAFGEQLGVDVGGNAHEGDGAAVVFGD